MQIQISWPLQKPTDLDLHSLLRQGMSCSAREGRVNCLQKPTNLDLHISLRQGMSCSAREGRVNCNSFLCQATFYILIFQIISTTTVNVLKLHTPKFPTEWHMQTFITKTRLFKYIENFTSKNWKFLDKNDEAVLMSTHNLCFDQK